MARKLDETATAAYRIEVEKLRAVLRDIPLALASHSVQQRNDSRNWGYAGDITNARANVVRCLEALGFGSIP